MIKSHSANGSCKRVTNYKTLKAFNKALARIQETEFCWGSISTSKTDTGYQIIRERF